MTSALISTWASIVGEGLVFGKSDNKSEDGSFRRPSSRNGHSSHEQEESDRPSPTSLSPIGGIPVRALVDELRQGNQDALATCYRALYTPLWRMATVLTHSRDQADEIIQDAFLSLWRRHAQLSVDLDLRAYLYAAVRNLAKQRARHQVVVARLEDAVASGVVLPPAFGYETEDPAHETETHDFYTAFYEALGLLKDRERLALRMRLEDELTFEQIGTILGISKMGAQKIVLRAEQKIRELLAHHRD